MSFISLKDIGKIYVSEGSVAVGIRGVNLEFELGEFVAVTGKSGSGKTTLLNIISGMDSYEEGEMLIEGEPTSHYIQSDWEEYRKKYISFIFQDYNIVDSFTVLQNVELALMHIEDHSKRRKRALELIERVGLKSHVAHKGSRLSGGQKQRTVIARALAKDSPVLLADEPTGNLDSKTSREIIELLKEISKDKLVIIVTHNFDQVEEFATRHIRIYDGAVESDKIISSHEPVLHHAINVVYDSVDSGFRHTLRNAADLGWVRYRAMPKLSVFIIFIMFISMLAASLVTATTDGFDEIFGPKYVVNHIDGRVIVSRRDGKTMTEQEVNELSEKTGAQSCLFHDYLLDSSLSGFKCTYEHVGTPDVGRFPEEDNEVFLIVPIGLKDEYMKLYDLDGDDSEGQFVVGDWTRFKISGLDFFYDNTKSSVAVFTERGFECATALSLFRRYTLSFDAEIELLSGEQSDNVMSLFSSTIMISFELPENSYALGGVQWEKMMEYSAQQGREYHIGSTEIVLGGNGMEQTSLSFDELDFVSDYKIQGDTGTGECVIIVSPDVLLDIVDRYYYATYYYQSSLFFKNDKEAENKIEELRNLGYSAFPSYSEKTTTGMDELLNIIISFFMIFAWACSMLFICLFMLLCTKRAMRTATSDIAVMRSMGIPVRVIKAGVYFQSAYCMIPAFIMTIAVMVTIYIVPALNYRFIFLHAPQYLLIFAAAVIITVISARGYNKAMFTQSVKKTLTGGESK